ncbi:hypothetical protein [Sphingobacterium hungaricum]|uniref:Uncharacterized protein n=1 Tax=Sphingobacterium hungaricum TaxID=2082723 RepID=A0A928YTM3_9SPHI|nr:hypothetical protein [Sphingobacterium hungaricum]MBE8715288.1 hypothetical protein [Sphingobacterium hungaricum]
MFRIIKKIVSTFGILISFFSLYGSLFVYGSKLPENLSEGFWGRKVINVDDITYREPRDFDNVAIPKFLAIFLNYAFTYITYIAIVIICLVSLTFFLKRLIKWYNDIVWERKYVKKPMDAWALNLLFICTLIIISGSIFNSLLAK